MKRFVQHTVTLGSRVAYLTSNQHQKLRGLASAVGGSTSDDARGGWPYAAGALFAAAALGYSGWQHDENLCWLRAHADAAKQPAAEAASSDRAAAFNTWLRGNGADFVAVNVTSSQTPGAGMGLVATPDMAKRSKRTWAQLLQRDGPFQVASFPLGSALTASNITQDPQLGPSYQELLDLGLLDPRSLVILHILLHRCMGDSSSLKPWLDLLPTSFDTPLWYGNEELQLLRGTTLWRAVELRRRSLEAQWKRLAPAVQELLRERLGVSGASLSFEDWLWAYSVFWSRGQSLPVQQEGEASTEEGIVPGLDFCNHRLLGPGTCWWEVQQPPPPPPPPPPQQQQQLQGKAGEEAAGGSVRLMCLQGSSAPAPGSEVGMNYGDKGNEELLMLYGFVQDSNPHDYVMVQCPLPPRDTWDEALEARMVLLQARGLRPQFFLSAAALGKAEGAEGAKGGQAWKVPQDVRDVLEVFVMDKKELSAALEQLERGEGEGSSGISISSSSSSSSSSSADISDLASLGSEVDAAGLDLAVASTLVRLLEVKLVQLEGSEEGSGPLEDDVRLLQQGGLSERRRACIVYRSGQKALVRRHLAAARRELQRCMDLLQQLVEQERRAQGLGKA